MKIFKIILIVILSILVVAITSIMVLLLTGKLKFSGIRFDIKTSNKLVYDKTYEQSFKRIVINSKAADIEIKNSSDDKARLVIYDDNDKANVVENSETLDVKINNKKCRFICFNFTISKVVLYLPTDYADKVQLVNDEGDITVGTFDKASLVIDSDTGDIKINSISNVTIDSDVGDVRIDRINNYVNVKTDVGDVRIKEANLNKDSSIKTDVGDVRITKTNQIFIFPESDVGDVKIGDNYRKADVVLKIKTDVGDIRVNKK